MSNVEVDQSSPFVQTGGLNNLFFRNPSAPGGGAWRESTVQQATASFGYDNGRDYVKKVTFADGGLTAATLFTVRVMLPVGLASDELELTQIWTETFVNPNVGVDVYVHSPQNDRASGDFLVVFTRY